MVSVKHKLVILDQIRTGIVRPTLKELGMWSHSAERLVLGTGLTESHYDYIYQVVGPAVGPYQVEPFTFNDQMMYLNRRTDIKEKADKMFVGEPNVEELAWNHKAAAAMCRIHYYRVPATLPEWDDITGMGGYWKKYYNTFLGKGTVEKFVDSASILGGLPK